MSLSVVVTCFAIVAARITDVTLDTVRTVSIVQGRRVFSATLGFVQALIYIMVVAKVLTNLSHPIYAVAFAAGFALGTYFGIVLEQRLAFGQQLAALITRKGTPLLAALQGAGYRVAQVQGQAGDHSLSVVYAQVPRRRTPQLLRDVGRIDGDCFCVVNDLRSVGYVPHKLAAAGKD